VAKDGSQIALAVPIQSLADFVGRVQPLLAQSIFSPANWQDPSFSGDVYPKFQSPPSSDGLNHRLPDPPDVQALRNNAQLLAQNMRDFVAIQTFAWGSGNKKPAAEAAYEIQVIDGYQRFREYPDGKKELDDVPLPWLNTAMSTGGEWSEIPALVGTQLKLKIHEADGMIVNGSPVKVFQYRADAKDGVCRFKSILDFGFFATSKIATVACYGEVWTDQDMNIRRMSEHFDLPGKWKNYEAVVTYDWVRWPSQAPRLVPFTISAQTEYKGKVYWCRGRFMNYRLFVNEVKFAQN